MTFSFFDGLAPLKFHLINLAVARNLHLEPFADRIHALGAHAVRAAGKFITALAVFAAGMQRRQHHLHAGNTVLRMNIHRDAASVVADGNRAVHMNGHFNLIAMTRQMFVHGIVQHLADAMMQRAFIRAADVHARLLAHSLQPLRAGLILKHHTRLPRFFLPL